MKASIIVFVWNMEDTLRKSIDSIIDNIGIDDYECILVDGNSDDESREICLEYQKYNKKITYIKLNEYDENKIWNTGIKYSNGEYLYFIKGCTYLTKGFINNAVEYLDENIDTNVFIRNYKVINRDNKIMDFFHFFEDANIGPRLSMCVFRKSSIQEMFSGEFCSEPIFSGKIVRTQKYYYEKDNLNSFIDTEKYSNRPFLYKTEIAPICINWIEYTQEKLNEYQK